MKNTNSMQSTEQNSTANVVKKRIVLITIGVLLVFLFGGYIAGAVYYRSHFLPNTNINGIACDNLEIHQAKDLLDSQNNSLKVELVGRDSNGEELVLGAITDEDINLKRTNYVVELNKYLDKQNPWLWVKAYANNFFSGESQQVSAQGYNIESEVSFDETLLNEILAQMLTEHNNKANQPQDAYISEYLEETNSYEIIPEQEGNTLDMEKVYQAVNKAFLVGENARIDLKEADCYVKPNVTMQDNLLQTTVDTVNNWLQAEITYDWNTNKVIVDKGLLKEWVSVDNNRPQLSQEAIEEFVAKQAATFDTYGKNRNFRTTLGVDLNLPSGAFGWKTDCEAEVKELIEAIKSGGKVSKVPVYSSKAPWKGTNDIGNSYVEIDLTNQHLYLYQKGTLVLESEFVSGDMDGDAGCATPPGVFGLTYKTMNAVLRGADYETPVVYWMPYHGNFGMHDATWRTEFGGDIYLTDGSHGCVNLPLESAAAIYSQISEGFPVICYYY